MEQQMAGGESLGQKWRTKCRQQPDRFRPLPGVAAARRRIEILEQQLIEQLGQTDLPLATRAIAFRSIMEVRACSAREAGNFFSVDPRVVVMGLSLLELPSGGAETSVSAPAAKRTRRSRTKAA
jgi:hypothetical protein